MTDQPGIDARAAVTEYIKESGVNWWHWLQDFWLIVDREGRDPEWWMNALRPLIGNTTILVMNVPAGDDWAGFVDTKGHAWLQKTWRT